MIIELCRIYEENSETSMGIGISVKAQLHLSPIQDLGGGLNLSLYSATSKIPSFSNVFL